MKRETSPRPTFGLQEIVYENPYQQVYRQVVKFSSFTKEYFVTRYGISAAVVVSHGDAVLLSRQYRLLIRRVAWEIPGGKVEAGERPVVAAARECLEETGIQCLNLKPLVHFYFGLDVIDSRTHIFHTDRFIEARDRRDVKEAQRPVWVPLSRCIEMVFAHEIEDSLSMVALLAFHQWRLRQPQRQRVRSSPPRNGRDMSGRRRVISGGAVKR